MFRSQDYIDSLSFEGGLGIRCSDPQDYIDSLLGMISGDGNHIPADYSVSITGLFDRVPNILIERHKCISTITLPWYQAVGSPSLKPDWKILDPIPEAESTRHNASKGFLHEIRSSGDSSTLTVEVRIMYLIQNVVHYDPSALRTLSPKIQEQGLCICQKKTCYECSTFLDHARGLHSYPPRCRLTVHIATCVKQL